MNVSHLVSKSAHSAKTVPLAFGHLPLSFEKNVGQTDPRVSFLSHGPGYSLFLSPSAVTFALMPTQTSTTLPSVLDNSPEAPLLQKAFRHLRPAAPAKEGMRGNDGFALRMRLMGSDPAAPLTTDIALPSKVSYLIGRNPKSFHVGLSTYGRVGFDHVYPGVNVRYYGNRQQLEYDFDLAPGADPATIQLAFDGASSVSAAKDGSLQVGAGGSSVVLLAPDVYQRIGEKRTEVSSHYLINKNNLVSFSLGNYDKTKPLIIDPVLVYSKFIGNNYINGGQGVAIDSSGCVYITGYVGTLDFPTTPGPIQARLLGNGNAFVTKVSADGSALIYSTYLGGENTDYGNAIAVDSLGEAIVGGWTNSANFPTTSGAFEPQRVGQSAGFVSKISSDGSSLVYSTYLGGHGSESGVYGIAVDSSGCAYATGSTSNSDFPITTGSLHSVSSAVTGNANCFITKINPSGSALVYSALLGGGSQSSGYALSVDELGCVYVTGVTFSTDFPVTSSAPQPAMQQGSFNAFAAKLNNSGTSLIYSTFIGGSGEDYGNAIAIDSSGCAYVAGAANSTDFPVTSGTAGGAVSNGGSAFVTKINAAGTQFAYSATFGGNSYTYATGVAVDGAGCAYLTGLTTSSDYPTTLDQLATAGNANGDTDGFVTKISADGSTFLFSTLLGDNQFLNAIAIDPMGEVGLSGWDPTNGVWAVKVGIGAAPNPPTQLAAAPGDSWDVLSWAPSANATSYNVYRSLTSGGPYTNIATGVTNNFTADTGLTDGQTYYYVLTAVNSVGESLPSAETSVMPLASDGMSITLTIPGNVTGTHTITLPNGSTITPTVSHAASPTGTTITVVMTPPPPTIAQPAAAASNPVTGTSVTLSVLGADQAGENTLTYTWSNIGTSTNPVSFMVNHSNAAKSTRAILTKAGNYPLQVTISDPNGKSVTSSIVITVSQTPQNLSISPNNPDIAPGATKLFAVSALDQFGKAVLPVPSLIWSVSASTGSGGTIDNSGLFTAGTGSGSSTNGTFTVSAVLGSLSASVNGVVTATVVTPPELWWYEGAEPLFVGSWSTVTGAASYNVYRGTQPGGEDTQPYASGISDTNWTDPNPINWPGFNAYYTVAAVDPNGTVSGPSNEAFNSQNIPGPVLLSATGEYSVVNLNWMSVPSACAYFIFYSQDPEAFFTGTATQAVCVNGSTTSYTLSGVDPAVLTYFAVSALTENSSGYLSTDFSNVMRCEPSGAEVTLSSILLSQTEVTGGTPVTGMVTLAGAAAMDTSVTLTSSSGDVTVPNQVTISAGSTSANFAINPSAIPGQETLTIIASAPNNSMAAVLTVDPASIASITFDHGSVSCGDPITATVTLTGPNVSLVTLSSDNPAFIVPQQFIVPSGQTIGHFTIHTTASTVSAGANITVTANGSSLTEPVAAMAHNLCSLTISTPSLSAGSGCLGTVTLTGPAAINGTTNGDIVNMLSWNPFATTPLSVVIPAGQSSATFPIITVSGVPIPATAGISAYNTTGVYSCGTTLTLPAPTSLTATVGTGGVQLSWTGVTGASGYEIYRSETSGGPYTDMRLIDVNDPVGTNYTDTTVQTGVIYYYAVGAVDSALNDSDKSPEASVSTPLASAPSMKRDKSFLAATVLSHEQNIASKTVQLTRNVSLHQRKTTRNTCLYVSQSVTHRPFSVDQAASGTGGSWSSGQWVALDAQGKPRPIPQHFNSWWSLITPVPAGSPKLSGNVRDVISDWQNGDFIPGQWLTLVPNADKLEPVDTDIYELSTDLGIGNFASLGSHGPIADSWFENNTKEMYTGDASYAAKGDLTLKCLFDRQYSYPDGTIYDPFIPSYSTTSVVPLTSPPTVPPYVDFQVNVSTTSIVQLGGAPFPGNGYPDDTQYGGVDAAAACQSRIVSYLSNTQPAPVSWVTSVTKNDALLTFPDHRYATDEKIGPNPQVVRVATYGSTATLTVHGTIAASVNNDNPMSVTQTTVSAGSQAKVWALGRIANRTVTINAPFDSHPNYSKGDGIDPATHWAPQRLNVVNEDGSRNIDTVITSMWNPNLILAEAFSSDYYSNISSLVDPPAAGDHGLVLNAATPNFINPYFTWSLKGDGVPDSITRGTLGGPYPQNAGVFNHSGYLCLLNLDFGSASISWPKHSTITVSVTDKTDGSNGADNAKIIATYNITWHQPVENLVPDGTNPPFWQPILPDSVDDANPAGYGGKNTSPRGHWWADPYGQAENLTCTMLGDALTVGAGLFTEPWSYIALSLSVTLPGESESENASVSFSDAWDDYLSTGLPPDHSTPTGNFEALSAEGDLGETLMASYMFIPVMNLKMQAHAYKGDGYSSNGYQAAPVNLQFLERVNQAPPNDHNPVGPDFSGDFVPCQVSQH